MLRLSCNSLNREVGSPLCVDYVISCNILRVGCVTLQNYMLVGCIVFIHVSEPINKYI
jgi:hypothetical protein